MPTRININLSRRPPVRINLEIRQGKETAEKGIRRRNSPPPTHPHTPHKTVQLTSRIPGGRRKKNYLEGAPRISRRMSTPPTTTTNSTPCSHTTSEYTTDIHHTPRRRAPQTQQRPGLLSLTPQTTNQPQLQTLVNVASALTAESLDTYFTVMVGLEPVYLSYFRPL